MSLITTAFQASLAPFLAARLNVPHFRPTMKSGETNHPGIWQAQMPLERSVREGRRCMFELHGGNKISSRDWLLFVRIRHYVENTDQLKGFGNRREPWKSRTAPGSRRFSMVVTVARPGREMCSQLLKKKTKQKKSLLSRSCFFISPFLFPSLSPSLSLSLILSH